MYATYAKLVYKLIILAKHFCIIIFSIFSRICDPLPFFWSNNQFVQFMCSSIFFKLYFYTIPANFKITCQPHRSWEQRAISRLIERAYKKLKVVEISLYIIAFPKSVLALHYFMNVMIDTCWPARPWMGAAGQWRRRMATYISAHLSL